MGYFHTVLMCRIYFILATPYICSSQTYNQTKSIHEDKINALTYNKEIRPLDDQSQQLNVSLSLQLFAMEHVDDVSQQMTVDVQFTFKWKDQRLSWDSSQYGGETVIFPDVQTIWRPRIGVDTEKADLFQSSQEPVRVDHQGSVTWAAVAVFTVACSLDMSKFPFDEHTCAFSIYSLAMPLTQLRLTSPQSIFHTDYFTDNGEWELLGSSMNFVPNEYVAFGYKVSTSNVFVTIKRRPTFLLLNTLLPVMLLTFLNMMTLLIPVESGEKVSYGITVLLALSTILT